MDSGLVKLKNLEVDLPTFEECMAKYSDKYFYVESGLERYYTESNLPSSDVQKILRNTRVLPINSDPTCEDSDGDGLDDGKCREDSDGNIIAPKDPVPLKRDMKTIKILRDQYINVKYNGSSDVWWGNTGRYPFGSAQDWFDNLAIENDNDLIKQVHYKTLSDYGCGLIAISDLCIYLACRDPKISIKEFGFYDSIYDSFLYDEYMSYLEEMSNRFLVLGKLGNIDCQFPELSLFIYINQQFSSNYNVFWNLSDNTNKCKKDIESMLNYDIPVIMSFDKEISSIANKTLDSGLLTELHLYTRSGDYKFKEATTIKSHYMTITGIYNYSDEVAQLCYKDIPSKTMLEVSSWGRKYYVNFDEYQTILSPFSNILEVIELK